MKKSTRMIFALISLVILYSTADRNRLSKGRKLSSAHACNIAYVQKLSNKQSACVY